MNQILYKHSESILQLALPTKVVQTLYTEEIISKQISNELENSEGVITYHQLTVLHTSMSENPNQLRKFATVLQQSEDTVCVANDILKEYSKHRYIIIIKIIHSYRQSFFSFIASWLSTL